MTHPYGQQTWNITTPGVRAVNESFDIQFAPGVAGQQGRVGPWLRSIQDPNNPGDTDGDGSESSVTTDLFTVNGKIWDGRLATPLVSDRTTYDRPGTGGQAD